MSQFDNMILFMYYAKRIEKPVLARKELTVDMRMLAEKATEIKDELTFWAESNGLLLPGEQLVFTLSVRSVPTVVREQEEDFRSMHPCDFFTREHMIQLGMKPGNAARAANGMRYTSGWNVLRNRAAWTNVHYNTIGEMMDTHKKRWCKIKNVGTSGKVFADLAAALKNAGFDIT